ncbi:helix-turn-helix transcriptional regulator [Kluyvera cryocrescens]|uniref:helix-turn-helix transcriptional regulator n=1 Tax=Kluyvera cryocrescens TaxID=580 RepID=UPI00385083F3
MAIKNGHMQYMAVNQSFMKLINLPVDYPIVGRKLDELPTSLAYLARRIHEQEQLVMQQRDKISSIVTHPIGKNASLQTMCFDSSPFYDDDGACVGTMLQISPVNVFCPSYVLEGTVPKPLLHDKPSDFFTNAEWEVIFLITMRLSCKDMSRTLGLSLKAVEHRISSCLQKTGTTCSKELLRFCQEKRWDLYAPPRFLKPRFRMFRYNHPFNPADVVTY